MCVRNAFLSTLILMIAITPLYLIPGFDFGGHMIGVKTCLSF